MKQPETFRARERAAKLPDDAVWRGLDELARTEEFCEAVGREFPLSTLGAKDTDESRRNFLRLMGASMALAGVYGCSERPDEKILPYVNPPEQVVPGMPQFFATAMPLNGYGYGVLAESHEGRPTKIEGNPDHPASLGGTNVFLQGSVLGLYDPERSRTVNRAGIVSTWESFTREVCGRLDAKRKNGGKGVRILTGTVTSPTLASQLKQFITEFPEAQWHQFDPLARVNTRRGAEQTFGRAINTVYRFRQTTTKNKTLDAKVIVSLDDDFLFDGPGSLRYARHFIAARQVRVRNAWQTTMSRLYAIESGLTITGSMADHRLPLKPSAIPAFARALAGQLGIVGMVDGGQPDWTAYLNAVVSDLKAPENRGATLVMAGESQPPEIHALVHSINAALGNVGKTLYYTEPVEQMPAENRAGGSPYQSLQDLTDDMKAGRVDTLVILGGNPAHTAPADVPFADALVAMSAEQQADEQFTNLTCHLGLYGPTTDDTAYRCQWHLPEAHYLEAWGDVRAFDGTASIIQPLIAPLHQGRSAVEVMNILLTPVGQYPSRTGYEIVRGYWKTQAGESFEPAWNGWLEKGIVTDSQSPAIAVAPATVASIHMTEPATQPTGSEELEIVFRADPSIGDGCFSNNGWLQEIPKPFTKLVWDNAALVSPRTADALRRKHGELSDGSILTFSVAGGRKIDAPIMVLPGVAEGVVVMHLGYGAQHGGSTALEPDRTPRGFNAYALRRSGSPWSTPGVSHANTGRFHKLVVTRNHHAMDSLPGFGEGAEHPELKPDAIEHPGMDEEQREISNRKLVRSATLAYFNASESNRFFVRELGDPSERRSPLSLYPGWDYSKGYQWGMSIDMQACIGCNACMVSCVAENNIPVVGREEVARQRDMHWIRIDQYFGRSPGQGRGDHGGDPLDNPRIYNQPVTCMHCENAPCEVVCPVGATVHSPEGLNEMVYNRCVGTRYCSNNCPYKVRRFNFFNFMKYSDPLLDLQHNPEVTVRSRGVMEKCTYCVQRLTRTRIAIEKMIVRLDQIQKDLQAERPSAWPDRQKQIDREIAEAKRNRHNQEFEVLERLQTACQQACPTNAIVFGNLLPVQTVDDQGNARAQLSKVAQLKQEPLDYPLLAELTTRPRTTYMARLRNPNPELEPEAKA